MSERLWFIFGLSFLLFWLGFDLDLAGWLAGW